MDDVLLLAPVSTTDHVLGNPDALVSIIEYGDFASPECREAAKVIKRLIRAKGGHIVYAFRHFPLEEIHLHAERAAEAAEAAAAQQREKFWEMHDLLLEHQDALDEDSLAVYADGIGLDLNRFVEDLASHRYIRRVNRHYMRGLQNGVHSTPTFFINTRLHEGSGSYTALLKDIRKARKRVTEGFV